MEGVAQLGIFRTLITPTFTLSHVFLPATKAEVGRRKSIPNGGTRSALTEKCETQQGGCRCTMNDADNISNVIRS